MNHPVRQAAPPSSPVVPTEPTVSEPRLVLPTKVYQHVQPDGHHILCAYPDSPARWTSLPVLDWIESLVGASEYAEACQHQLPMHASSPISINNVQLGQKSPPIPAVCKSELNIPLTDDQKPEGIPNCNRRLESNDEWLCQGVSWDMSYIHQRDAHAWTFTRQINNLVGKLESYPIADMDASDLLQSRLNYSFGSVFGQFPHGTPTEYGEIRQLLDTLYENIIRKLHILMEKAQSSDSSSQRSGSPLDATLSDHDFFNASVSFKGGDDTTGSNSLVKKDFGSYMTTWLRDNWTNPYPDEDGLIQLAQICDTTPTQVSNWLINARTRKWRPGIIKATEMNRPAALLLEDSISIFDGKPVREIKPSKTDGNALQQGDCTDDEVYDHYSRSSKRQKMGLF